MTSPAPFTRLNSPPFLTIEQVAAVFQTTNSAIEEQVKRGELPKAQGLGPRTIRIPREAIWTDEAPPALDFTDRRIAGLLRDAQEAAGQAWSMAELVTEQAEIARRLVAEAAELIDAKAVPRQLRKAS